MPRGDKSKYTDKQKRKAEHIEEGYEQHGVGEREAERRAWATVNKESGGGNRSGSGRNRPDTHESSRKGGRIGGHHVAAATRSEAAKKGWETRRRHAQARAVKLAALVLDRPQQEILTAGLLDRLEKLACQDLAKCACFNAVLEGLKAAGPTS